ncbi:U3 small nucleolar RNA-associated protein 14 homolog B-like [Oppia nitens]|uniref:U3 small nucleolar RNA-associated protein 14 homolog B-like n=1 Tax=Oppia nitens TaxID=1686743 RepID=UPI0023DC616B|nr:U3 small nucleolar RNA-associated protein 14 homolog B-like [Oppia nitens]
MMATSKVLQKIKPRDVDNSGDEDFVTADKELMDSVEDNDNRVIGGGGSDDDVNYDKLLADVSLLDSAKKKQLKWKATRFEAKDVVNEFNLSQSDKTKLSINDLLSEVRDTGTGNLKKLKHWHKRRLLDEPLERSEAKKIKRAVNYDQTGRALTKWDPVVDSNRAASQLKFPLNQKTLSLEPAKEVVKKFTPKTPMELQIAEMLSKSENTLTDDKALTVAEEKIMKAMSLDEARIRHREIQKMRALMSYQEVKLKRQAKIKSKRYHRILKRERLKKSLEEFEKEKKENPDAAIDKLQELEKLRALERASLKHKNTGKWAKHLKLRSKYDDNARAALSEQLQISNKLLQKKVHFEDDDNDDDNNNNSDDDSGDDEEDNANKDDEFTPLPNDYNPWMRSGSTGSGIVQPKPQHIKQISNDTNAEDIDRPINYETSGPISDEQISADLDVEFIEDNNNNTNNSVVEIDNNSVVVGNEKTSTEKVASKEAAIDPNDFITVKANKVKSSFPNLVTDLDSDGEDNDDDESDGVSDDEQRQLVSEAFADDDVLNDFKKSKREKIENESEKNVSLFLPGWGQWGGVGLKISKKKKKRFTLKPAKKGKRKDHSIGNVIISEKKDETVGKYRVKQLPFPYKNVEEFEKSIRHPIGRTWNPEVAYRELTEPKLVTKIGAIIDPIDKEALINSRVGKNKRNSSLKVNFKSKRKHQTNQKKPQKIQSEKISEK